LSFKNYFQLFKYIVRDHEPLYHSTCHNACNTSFLQHTTAKSWEPIAYSRFSLKSRGTGPHGSCAYDIGAYIQRWASIT